MGKREPYKPPVAGLLAVGEPAAWGANSLDRWPDYTAMGLSASDSPELLRMAKDKDLHLSERGSSLVWAPLHTWRALGQLRAVEAVVPLLEMLEFLERINDDAGLEEMPAVLSLIGPPAIEPVGLYLEAATNGLYSRIAAAMALSRIGNRFAESRDLCIEQLCHTLGKAKWNDTALNCFIVLALMYLKAHEAADLIRKCFDAGDVEEEIVGDWEAVATELGVEV